MLTQLQAQLGYHFHQPELLLQAFTHRSVTEKHNERLEFLGDAILNALIADALYKRFPQADEGELSRMRATLVCGTALAELARILDLGRYLQLGPGEIKNKGAQRQSILSGALEALVGAVYLDQGIRATRRLVMGWYRSRLSCITPGEQQKDAKTRLQEWLQHHRLPLPVYRIVQVQGEAHRRTFTVECQIQEVAECFIGIDSSRRLAEQRAAEKALQRLQPSC